MHELAEDKGEGTRARNLKRALALEEAFEYVAGDDPRPLLILRECITCTKTDDALMTRQADNEKTMLLSRWFHCVKLSPAVLEEDHPFHNFFAGKDPAHLFVAGTDGSNRLNLKGDQSRTELWRAMEKILDGSYEKNATDKVLRNLLKILDRYDGLDGQIAELERKRDRAIEKQGPDSSKFKKIVRQLNELRAKRAELRSDAIKVSKLKLKVAEEPADDDDEEEEESKKSA